MNWRKVYNFKIDQRNNRLKIALWRFDNKPIRCGWDTLQRIKNELVGEDVSMVEYFPSTLKVVNEVNRRHLWEITEEEMNHGF